MLADVLRRCVPSSTLPKMPFLADTFLPSRRYARFFTWVVDLRDLGDPDWGPLKGSRSKPSFSGRHSSVRRLWRRSVSHLPVWSAIALRW
jgi:hypothetical protein